MKPAAPTATAAAARPSGRTELLVSVSAAVGSFLFGYDTGVIAGALLYIEPEFELEDETALIGLIVSSTLVGACLGTLAGGAVNDRFGRRRPLFATAALFVAGGLLMALAPDVAWLIVGRFIVGAAIGVSGAIIPVYIAECAPAAIRGRLATFPQLFVSLGIFTSYLIDFGVSVSDASSWRLMLGISVVPAVVQFLLLLWLPESPRWLLQQGEVARARAVLERLRETDDVNDEMAEMAAALRQERWLPPQGAALVHGETAPLLDAINTDQRATAAEAAGELAAGPADEKERDGSAVPNPSVLSWSQVHDLVRRTDVRKALLIGCGLQMFQQLSGINATIYFTPSILKAAGVTDLFAGLGLSDESASILAATVTYSLKIPAILLTMFIIDRVGRRRLLLITVPVLSVSLAILATAFALDAGSVAQPILSMCAIAIYGCFFSAGLGPIPNILSSEIFPLQARALGLSVCVAVQWAFNILVSQTFPSLVAAAGETITFALFSGLCAAAVVFIALAVPETKGRNLDRVADLLADRTTPTAAEAPRQ